MTWPRVLSSRREPRTERTRSALMLRNCANRKRKMVVLPTARTCRFKWDGHGDTECSRVVPSGISSLSFESFRLRRRLPRAEIKNSVAEKAAQYAGMINESSHGLWLQFISSHAPERDAQALYTPFAHGRDRNARRCQWDLWDFSEPVQGATHGVVFACWQLRVHSGRWWGWQSVVTIRREGLKLKGPRGREIDCQARMSNRKNSYQGAGDD